MNNAAEHANRIIGSLLGVCVTVVALRLDSGSVLSTRCAAATGTKLSADAKGAATVVDGLASTWAAAVDAAVFEAARPSL